MNRSALIAVLLTLTLAACGEKAAETVPAPVAPAPVVEQAPATEPAAGSEAAPAAAPAEGAEAAPAAAPAPAAAK